MWLVAGLKTAFFNGVDNLGLCNNFRLQLVNGGGNPSDERFEVVRRKDREAAAD